jgi:integrase
VAVRHKGGRWQVEFQQRGVRVFRRLYDGATKAQAQALETKLRSEIFSARDLGLQPELTLQAAIDLWLKHTLSDKKDQKKPVQNAALLRPFVGNKLISQAPEASRACVSHWTKQSLSTSTINRRLAVLKAACHWSWKQGWAQENLSGKIPRLREAAGREIYLTRSQVHQLASAAPTPSSHAAILLASYTGLRTAELLALAPSHSGLNSLNVSMSKTGKPRVVPVPEPARRYLSALPLGLSYSQLRKEFLVAKHAAGLDHVRFHDLRHTCASWLINAGVDLYTVGRILGHSSAAHTTARYAHLADKTLKRAMGKLR